MKLLQRNDLFSWSEFNEERNLDFNSWLWVRSKGNVLIDPLPMTEHDRQHLERLGGAEFIIVTNSDHCRDAEKIAGDTGAHVEISNRFRAPLSESDIVLESSAFVAMSFDQGVHFRVSAQVLGVFA